MDKELDIHPEVESAWKLFCPTAFDAIEELDDLETSYRSGGSQAASLEDVTDQLMILQNTTFNKTADRRGQELAEKYGCNHVPIGTVTSKTQSDLENSRPLMVGPVGLGAICTITHPDVGIALSHQDTITREIEAKFARELLSDGGNENRLVGALVGENQVMINEFLDPSDGLDTLQRVGKEAILSFAKMLSELGNPKVNGNLEVNVCGLRWCKQWREQMTGERVAQIITSGEGLGGNASNVMIKAELHSDIGMQSKIFGLVYGGPAHPTFSSPLHFSFT